MKKLLKWLAVASGVYLLYKWVPGHDHSHPYKCPLCGQKRSSWQDHLDHMSRSHKAYSDGSPRPMN
jgi:hypothetical protein